MAGAVCAGLAVSLAGCGDDPDAGTNGVGKLTADGIQSRAVAAARAATTVRVSGTVAGGGHTYKLDMRLKDDGGSGSVTTGRTTFRLLRVGDHLYLKADAAFWTHSDGHGSAGAAAQKLGGKYVKVPEDDPAYRRFSPFTDKDALLKGLLTLHGPLAKGDRRSAGGVRTIALSGDKGAGGTLDVSLEGRAYPMRLDRAGNAGTLRLTEWGRDFTLTEPAPADTVDYGKKLPAS
ncbi:hypothetical protein OFY01_14680 [Streptomyces sp. GXMU-J5]|uniref:Lipoprotein n=1 Tax=Streptomyces beihaiensis TaxID=2984495 RepID=A0ABT3TVC1_9ACTN|nr:hypothetical protein [Streptomyces beihaiensis]MCX3060978.1 hypothetical protein [Streptomyces beihaiensis]